MNAHPPRTCAQRGFTRLDAAAVIAVISLLLMVAFPAVTRNALAATGITCVGNLTKLNLAWQLYAAENGGKLVNNFGLSDTLSAVSAQSYLNWNHNLMDWTTNPSNTNRTLMAASKLYPYLQNPNNPFKCPADRFVSTQQSQAGWFGGRLRSYSMNGYMGGYAVSTNDSSYKGQNFLGPMYRQFILSSSIPDPSRAIVFLDEHPDSINDGYFINVPNATQWYDLPGSHHNGAGGVSFADGRVEVHAWLNSATKQPVRFGFVGTGPLSPSQRTDHTWIAERMTVVHSTLAMNARVGESEIVWTPSTSTYVLQSSPSLAEPNWNTVPEQPVKGSGQVNVTTGTDAGERYFRLAPP